MAIGLSRIRPCRNERNNIAVRRRMRAKVSKYPERMASPERRAIERQTEFFGSHPFLLGDDLQTDLMMKREINLLG